jgi:putative ABC transport system permease protein
VKAGIGFDAERLAVVDVELPDSRYPDAPSRARFLNELLTRARNMPGVTSAAITDTLPLHYVTMVTFNRADRPKQAAGKAPVTDVANISPGYLNVIGVPVLAGRPLTDADVARNNGKGDGVVLINQSFADTYLSGEDPLSVRLMLDGGSRAYQVVGVVKDFRALGAEEDVRPQYFRAGVDTARSMLVLRTAVPPESLAGDARALLWSLDKELVTADVGTMEAFIDRSLELRWFGLVLLAAFAALALLLAMIGIYSVLANLVASRTREIGIRMALGAQRAEVLRMVVTGSMRAVLLGAALGLIVALAATRMLSTLLFGVEPRDPVILLSVTTILGLSAVAAALVAARRAVHIAPLDAMRGDS